MPSEYKVKVTIILDVPLNWSLGVHYNPEKLSLEGDSLLLAYVWEF